MALLARVWMRKPHGTHETLDAPLRGFQVEPLGGGGARVAFALPEGRVALAVASADDFQGFAAAAAREATTPAKCFYTGAFTLEIDGFDAARGKRMVSFVKGDARIFHAWCEEGILHTVWKPVELRMGFAMLVDELARLRAP